MHKGLEDNNPRIVRHATNELAVPALINITRAPTKSDDGHKRNKFSDRRSIFILFPKLFDYRLLRLLWTVFTCYFRVSA